MFHFPLCLFPLGPPNNPSNSHLTSLFILSNLERKEKTQTNVSKGGFTHGFVSHFANEEDRKYYLEEDPAHLGFVKSLGGIIENVRVVDYEAGKF